MLFNPDDPVKPAPRVAFKAVTPDPVPAAVASVPVRPAMFQFAIFTSAASAAPQTAATAPTARIVLKFFIFGSMRP
jgi:hypothetical protein